MDRRIGVFCLVIVACTERGAGPVRKHVDPSYVTSNLLSAIPSDLRTIDADLGGKVVYIGNRVDRMQATPGDKIQVRHYWRVVAPPGASWQVFTHLRGDAGTADFVNLDASDMRWGHPPTAWKAQEIIQDVQDFVLPPTWKSKKATLLVGLYQRGKHAISDRLPVARGPSVDSAVIAAEIAIDLEKAPPPPGTVVARKTTSPITIDGSADEPGWLAGTASGDFVTAEGSSDPPGRTAARLTWDDQSLYIYASIDDPDVFSPYRVDDEPLWKADVLEVFVDADGNQRGYIELQVNPNRARFDSWFATTRAAPGDVTWASGMTTAVVVRGTADNRGDRDQGWAVEMAIPWAAVKGRDSAMAAPTPPTVGARYRLNVLRVDYAAEKSNPTIHSWNKIGYSDFHALDRMLTVVFADAEGRVAAAP